MPSTRVISNESPHAAVVSWINANPLNDVLSKDVKQDILSFDDLTPEGKVHLISILTALQKQGNLPEVFQQWFPSLLEVLPQELLGNISTHLTTSEVSALVSTNKNMHALFIPPNKVLNKFLQRVAYGEQDQAERLFTEVYSDKEAKIQEALRYAGSFTDYSGRTFNCTAYEYAYWAKDTHMCRMLERHMDEETKASILARIDANDRAGLNFQQNGEEKQSAHFDLTELKTALQDYFDGFPRWASNYDFEARVVAWLKVGKAQRDVPAHVAQEYCREDRTFVPCPLFTEPTLPRVLTFMNWVKKCRVDSWFPLAAANSGLGSNFGLSRANMLMCTGNDIWLHSERSDLEAITRLDQVRTADLALSRANLILNRVLNGLLQCVAYGEQDRAEQLFTEVYRDKKEKIQEALRYQGSFTDYSGRTFHCTAYEYAYWAKDTHMCRMLESHMDEETKASMLARINANDTTGLSFQQNGEEKQSAHFDLTALKTALQTYVDGRDAWKAASNEDAIKAAWIAVGKAQQDVPAHVAQEYCRKDRSFDPCPPFNEPTLPRVLTFYYGTSDARADSWFPLASSNSGLGFKFGLLRAQVKHAWSSDGRLAWKPWVNCDLAAITRLDEVRTADLTLSREHLNPQAPSRGLST